MNQQTRAKIEAATVRFTRRGGQGVVVPGRMIATAAQVVSWDAKGGVVLGHYHIEAVEANHRTLKVRPLAVERVADIAVLGALDGQVSAEHAAASDAFEAFCDSTAPVAICTADFPLFAPFPVHILAHTGRWLSARAQQRDVNAPVLTIEASEGIDGGTSGGPVVTDSGLLLGVVSNRGGPGGEPVRTGSVPRLHVAAPGWLVRLMIDPQWGMRTIRSAKLRRSE